MRGRNRVGGTTLLVAGIMVLGIACGNWRYIAALTRAVRGAQTARKLAQHPLGNKICGTGFLVMDAQHAP